MKKFISAFLFFAFIVSLTGSALATNVELKATPSIRELSANAQAMLEQDLGREYLNAEFVESVESDLALFHNTFLIDDLSIEHVNANGEFLYSKTYESGIVNYLAVSEDLNGTIQLDCYEGDKHDQLIFAPNGKLFLDGFEVTATIDEEATDETLPVNTVSGHDITPFAAGFENSYSLRSSTSIPEDYSQIGDPIVSATISFGKRLGSMTVSGVKAVIYNGAVNLLQKISFLVGGWQSALAFSFGACCDYMADRLLNQMVYLGADYANSDTASFRGKKYVKAGSRIAPRYIYSFDYFAQKDFSGEYVTKTILHEQDPR